MTTAASQSLRIVFAGTPHFARAFLQLLLDTEHQIVGVYTQPDRPAGRGKKLQPSPVKSLAADYQLPVFQPLNFKQQDAVDELASLKADLMIVVAYGIILPEVVLNTPRQGCINVHASVLPRWRGAAPIQRAIEAGDQETGVTIMQMDKGLDTGDMLSVATCTIDKKETTMSLHDKLIDTGESALLETLDAVAKQGLKPVKQDDQLATYAQKIDKAEGQVDWQQDAATIDRKIRAFNPFPVAYSLLKGERIKIHRAYVLESLSQGTTGQINRVSEQGIDIQTGAGTIRVEMLQIPGKKAMPCADILRGYPELFVAGASFDRAP